MRTLAVTLAFILLPLSIYASHIIVLPVRFFPASGDQCGPASLAMVLNYLGVKLETDQISKEIYSPGARGTWELDMIIFPKRLGLRAKQYRGSIDDIREKISKGKPLIVMVDEGIWFQRKYHYMVVIGYGQEEIIVNSGNSEKMPVRIEEFLKKWEKTDFWTLYIDREVEDGSS